MIHIFNCKLFHIIVLCVFLIACVLYRLRDAEQLILKENGIVVRLGGLYNEWSGPQSIYKQQLLNEIIPLLEDNNSTDVNIDTSKIMKKENKRLNMIHYEDASDLVNKCLFSKENLKSKIFLGIDNKPVRISEIFKYQIDEYLNDLDKKNKSHKRSMYDKMKKYLHLKFSQENSSLLKQVVQYDNEYTRNILNWNKLKHSSLLSIYK